MNEVIQAIKARRSVRTYKNEQIKKEELDLIIESGIYAPTAHNEQPWHFTVIQNEAMLENINNIVREGMVKSENEWVKKMGEKPSFKVTYNAPTLVIVSGRESGMAWQADCSAAIQNMLIAAESLNIGSVWIGLVRFLFNHPEEMKKLNIPEGYIPYYGVCFGYKANENPSNGPKRNMDVVNYIF